MGDIAAVYNESGTKLVSYKYDAWGNFTTTYHNSGENTYAVNNPFTYRGYYYDRDLEMYYLGSRYYDSVVKRFISSDKMLSGNDDSLGGKNLYAYCFNNPVMFTDESGNWPKWIKNVAKAIKDFAYSVYYAATEWHFEGREEKNGEHPTYSEVNEDGSGWDKLKESQSIYHDNGVGNPELKYTHPDGREAVFDGDTFMPITDPRYIATYNYCPMYQPPYINASISDYAKIAVTAVGHFFADMLPYYIMGNSNTRTQFESKIVIFN